eukprot:TRINITY_DN22124_c0_g1_i3.p1 TRINITY_DN22124_c0_g1~~TRINITY_DN22124_c0_g1_i3.p1  ORF type:complete len:143 (+),score=18.32 TRINITY_DN22124_c0_g1_i3:139-567(+)
MHARLGYCGSLIGGLRARLHDGARSDVHLRRLSLAPRGSAGTCVLTGFSDFRGDRASGHARITKEILALQNSVTSQTVLEAYADDQRFKALSNRLYQQILQRDAEDRDKLQKGIQLAIAKGVLPRAVSVDSTAVVNRSCSTM